MSRFSLELATRSDDRDLRTVIANTTMPGRVALSFRREPSYFDGAAVEGDWQQVVVARDEQDGRVVGFGSRSGRALYVNGQPMNLGYLSNLRLLPSLRGGSLLARGYRKFKELHQDGRAPFYLTSIAEHNRSATRLLTSARAGLPAYHPLGTYHTLVLPISRRPVQHSPESACSIRAATQHDLVRVGEFLNEVGSRYQFFPCYRNTDFTGDRRTFRGLEASDILLAFDHADKDKLVGVLGLWDQHTFRQTVVESYGGLLKRGRWLYNAWAWSRGKAPLPHPGSTLPYLTAAFPVVRDDRSEVLTSLLKTAVQRRAAGDWQYLLLGLHKTDPCLAAASRLAREEYVTRIFAVHWEDGKASLDRLDARPLYLELGCL